MVSEEKTNCRIQDAQSSTKMTGIHKSYLVFLHQNPIICKISKKNISLLFYSCYQMWLNGKNKIQKSNPFNNRVPRLLQLGIFPFPPDTLLPMSGYSTAQWQGM